MDRIKNYFSRPYNTRVMQCDNPLPRFAWKHLVEVNHVLTFGFMLALLGGFLHHFFNIGGWITAVGFILTSWSISRIQPWREFPRLILLMAAAFFFGVTLGPLINLFIEMKQSDVIKILMSAMVFSVSHFSAVLLTLNRKLMYKIDEFCSPIFIIMWLMISETYSTTIHEHSLFLLLLPFQWQLAVFVLRFLRKWLPVWFCVPFHVIWISLLCYFFDFPRSHFLYVYLLVVLLNVHTKMHSQYAIYQLARPNVGIYYVSTTIAFFTDVPAHAVAFFQALCLFGRFLARKIKNKLRLRFLQQCST